MQLTYVFLHPETTCFSEASHYSHIPYLERGTSQEPEHFATATIPDHKKIVAISNPSGLWAREGRQSHFIPCPSANACVSLRPSRVGPDAFQPPAQASSKPNRAILAPRQRRQNVTTPSATRSTAWIGAVQTRTIQAANRTATAGASRRHHVIAPRGPSLEAHLPERQLGATIP